MPKNKTDNFLNAIKKYAKEQKNAMKGEVKQLKTERLKEAEEKAKYDSSRLVKEKLYEKRAKETAALASKTQEGQRRLFIERANMTEEIFGLVTDKLNAYTQTDNYSAKLIESSKEIAKLFENEYCVIFVRESDMSKADEIKAQFPGGADVKADKTIKLGGVRGYCESKGIIADETLDSKLEAQREWFCENAALSVL